MRTLLILAFGTLVLSGPTQAATSLHRFVLAAGANDGGHERVQLRYAITDAAHFNEVLQAMGGVSDRDAILLAEPTIADIRQAFTALKDRLDALDDDARTEIVFYYSGHADQDGLLLGEKRLPYRDLRQQLDDMPADVRIAVLDACASGAMTRLKGGTREKAFLVDESNAMRGHAFLTSSSADEAAQESDRIQASFFTHYLVSGLRGAADVSGDGKVSLSEAYQFAFDQTLERTTGTLGGAQHPAYDIELSGTGGVIMTDMRQTTTSLTLGENLNGRVFIRDADRRLVAELLKPAGRPVELGLGTGAYEIRYERIEALGTVNVSLNAGEKRELNEWDFTPTALEQTALRGGGGGGARIEYQDGFDFELAGDHTLSFGFFNRQKQEFNGTQVALVNKSDERAGTQLAPIANIATGALAGSQLTGVANIATTVRGVQLAGVFNSGKRVKSVQAAGVANITEVVRGPQLAGVVNVSKESAGPQLAGVVNSAKKVNGPQMAGTGNIADEVGGPQMAGGVNIAKKVGGPQMAGVVNVTRKIKGPQIAGVANAAQKTSGPQIAGVVNTAVQGGSAQIAGVVNVANEISGAQISGVVNVAQNIKGAQIGLINLSRDIDGVTLGLFNYSHTGRLAADNWIDANGTVWLTASSGSRSVYSLYSVGIGMGESDQPLAVGLGIGARFAVMGQPVEIDASSFRVARKYDLKKANTLGRLRVLGIRDYGGRVKLFAGLALDTLWRDGEDWQLSQPGAITLQEEEDRRLTLGAFAGLRVSR